MQYANDGGSLIERWSRSLTSCPLREQTGCPPAYMNLGGSIMPAAPENIWTADVAGSRIIHECMNEAGLVRHGAVFIIIDTYANIQLY